MSIFKNQIRARRLVDKNQSFYNIYISIHNMAKTIAVSDDVYEMLSKAKMKGESFSDVIRRLLKRQKISDIPKILEDYEAKKIKELIEWQKEADLKRLKELL